MLRFLVPLAVALVLAPTALAGKVNPVGLQDDQGAVFDGVRYVARGNGANTVLAALGANRSLRLAGSWGIPRIDTAAAISFDGRTLVLMPTQLGSPTRYTIVDTATLRVRKVVRLPGMSAYDALSPDGTLLYVIAYSSSDLSRYVVRAVDLRTGRLLPGRIADPAQKSWLMQGWPVSRTSTSDGRWVYTLYANPGGYGFVHALDTVGRTARCTGVPWRGDASEQWSMRLALRPDGKLAVDFQSGAPYIAFDVSTWKIDYLG